MRKQHTVTAETQAAAKLLTGEDLPVGTQLTLTAPKGSTPRLCLCGCKELTAGGLWVPGHDAKHKSRLFALARGTHGPEQKAAAEKELRERGWGLPTGRKAQAVEPLKLS